MLYSRAWIFSGFVVCLLSFGFQTTSTSKDELASSSEACDESLSFQCASNPGDGEALKHMCIPRAWVCDDDVDCPLGDDEEQDCEKRRHKCADNEFSCGPKSSMKCIQQAWTCDGEKDCDLGEDEMPFLCMEFIVQGSMVDTFKCPPNHYRCPETRTCIHLFQVCDGMVDCKRDGADEGPHCINRACHSKGCPEDMCKETSQGARCYCHDGYGWNDTLGKCHDINECEYDHFCDQTCNNKNGSYECSCQPEYIIVDNHLCQIPDNSKPRLAIANYNRLYVGDVKQRSGKLSIRDYAINGKQITTLDVDVQNNSVCWITYVSTDKSKMMCADMDNADAVWEVDVQYSLKSVRSMAKDWISGNWYFADETKEMIFLCSSDGRHCKSIVHGSLRRPKSIVIDPTRGYLFYSDWSTAHIDRVDLDGSNLQVLALIKLVHPNGLTLDLTKGHVYWGDSFLNVIERIDYDGRNRRIISKGSDVSHVFGMTILENHLYVANHFNNSIVRVHRYDHNVPNRAMYRMPSKPGNIKMFHPALQPTAGVDVCKNASCDQMCIPVPDRDNASSSATKAKCGCWHGYFMNGTTSKCQERTSQDFFMICNGQQGMVHFMSSVPEEMGAEMYPPISNLGQPRAVAFDSVTGFVYVSDLAKPWIRRRKYNSPDNPETFVDGLTCDGLAVDWIGRNLYCADSGGSRIVAVRLDNSTIMAVVIDSEMAKQRIYPKTLVVDPFNSDLFFGDWVISATEDSANASINRINMDGTGFERLTHQGIQWANGLVLDKEKEVLYWCDAYFDRIESVKTNGTDRKTMHTFITNRHPYGIAVFQDKLVLSETTDGTLWTFDPITNTTKTLRTFSPPIFDIIYHNKDSQPPIDHPCGTNNGGCTDVCLLGPETSAVCKCAEDRLSTDNGTTCTGAFKKRECHPLKDFTCGSGECIPKVRECDGTKNCIDGSDEDKGKGGICEGVTCPTQMFQCNNSRCIYQSFVCDGEMDCVDGDDEVNCNERTCPPEHFQCSSSGQCYPETWKCDEEKDCPDGSDEDPKDCCPNGDCSTKSCGADTFKCLDGQCIKYEYRCDNEYDCSDLSDEVDCGEWCDPVREFKCNNMSRCLPKVFKCDGIQNCPDGSDERNCESINFLCHDDEFACLDGTCIKNEFKCDNRKDCIDGSDESNCAKNMTDSDVTQCHWTQFMCEDKSRCIPTKWQCDNDYDCKDQSDEKHCAEECPMPNFACLKHPTMCLNPSKVCDNVNDCPDHSDEGRLCAYDLCLNHDCEYKCHRTPYSYVCSCPENKRLKPDNKTCVDIDICHQWGICGQHCSPVASGHRCYCKDGYSLKPDNYSCKADDPEPVYIIYSNRHQIYRINLHNNSVVSLVQGLQNTIAIDFHIRKSLIIWTDPLDDKIYKGEMIANSVTKVHPIVQYGLAKAEGIAVDWITESVYWVDSNADQIEVAKLDGSYRTTLLADNMTSPRALVLDPRVGTLFWTDWDGNHPRIESCSLAGEVHTRRVLYDIRKNTDSGWPNGITLDYETHRIYWADARSHSIHTIKYDGSDHRLVAKAHRTLDHPFSITQFGEQIFWTDWKLNALVMASKFNGSDISVVHRTYSQPFDLQVYHPKRQPYMPNPCDDSECSHLCLIGDGLKPVCRCPHRFKMSLDGKTCTEDKTFLLFVKEKEIRGVDLDNAHYNVIPSISVPFVENASSIDYDIKDDRLYWTDMNKNVIISAYMNGTGITTVIDSGLSNPSAFTIDWLSRNMYFSSYDDKRAAISVAQLDGAYRKEIFNKTKAKPNSIALHPAMGVMYWSDHGTEPAIWKAKMDGGDPKVFASGQDVVKPGSLSLDLQGNRLYWIERHSGSFMWCSLDKSPCQPNKELDIPVKDPITTMTIYNKPKSATSTETKEFLFYSASNIIKYENGRTKILQKNTPHVNDLQVYDPRIREGKNGCSENNGGCSQLCLPSGSSTVCACTVGFIPAGDGKACKGIDSFLLYSLTSEIRGLTIEQRHTALAPISKISTASSIDFHDDHIYWVDSGRREISRIKRDLSGRETIVHEGISGAESLAVDWMSGHIYWTDLGHKIIEMSRLNGTGRYVVISENLDKPLSLVVNPKLGYIYFADWGSQPKIVRAYLDGSEAKPFVVSTASMPIKSPYGLAIDHKTNDLYWCDKDLDFIERVTVDGERSKVVTSNLTDCTSLAIYEDYLFWADSTDLDGSIKFVHKVTGQGKTVLLHSTPRLKDIMMYDAKVHVGNNPCSINNGGCEELCFYRGSRGVSCACSHGKLKADRKGCQEYKGFLLYSEVTSLKSLHLHSTDPNAPRKPIKSDKHMQNVIGLAFDYYSQKIFYSDIQKGSIQSVFFNGTGFKTILQGLGSAEGLAYSPTDSHLYWTSYSGSNINRISFPPDAAPVTKVILQLNADDHPRDIVINPCIRRIFWTNWSTVKPSIQTAVYLSNPRHGQRAVTEIQSIVTEGIRVPNGLTIDHKGQRLYWSDARLDKIEGCDMDGRNRKVIVDATPYHSFGLAVHGSHIYWTDWLLRSVVRANKFDGGEVTWLKTSINRQPMGIIAVAEDTDDCTLNPCFNNAYGCSHYCTVDPKDNPVCSCPEDLKLMNDSRRCILKGAVCKETDFVCEYSRLCVPFEKTCNGITDCPDGSDESFSYCYKRNCPEGFYGCHTGHQCIPNSKVCDKQMDCGDNSDEMDCPCADNEFRCNSGMCIHQKYRCDLDSDCPDFSDEIGCENTCNGPGSKNNTTLSTFLVPCNTTSVCIYSSWICDGANDCHDNNDEINCNETLESATQCKKDSFRCDSGGCITAKWVCDKENDCGDGSDERNCNYTCSDGQHVCSNNNCIPFSWVCDGHPDCLDSSDETEHCISKNCTENQFQCPSGRCISKDWVCDGESDCSKGEDERMDGIAQCDPIECGENQFTCLNRKCISQDFFCDGERDCEDGSDEPEDTCVYAKCEDYEFECKKEPQCIKGIQRCDGVIDCNDHTDELECAEPVNSCNNASMFECWDKLMCIASDLVCDGKRDCVDGSDESPTCGIDECSHQVPICSHMCIDRPIGYECRCFAGYQIEHRARSRHNNDNYGDGANRKCHDLNECETTFPCSHYCTNTIGSFKCSCPQGYTLMPDARSCRVSDGITPQLLVSNRYYLRLINITHEKISTLTSQLKNSVAVDYDWRSQTIFWSDISSQRSSISSMGYNFTSHTPGEIKVLHSQTVRNPDGLAVDWVGRNLYWCDKTTDTIEVSTLDGRYRKVLLREGLQEPRALEVYPQKGLLFVTDWGEVPHIGRMNMDGSDYKMIINESLDWPNALTIDYVTEKIFWADGKLDYIGMADLDGKNPRIIVGEGKKVAPHVFAITTFENQLYWTDWEHIGIYSAKKFSGHNATKIISLVQRPMDIHVVHPLRQQPVLDKFGRSPCDKALCSHLCLLRPGPRPNSLETVCACPEYHYLDSDGRSCVSNCTSSQFLCKSSSKCIPFWWQCDGSKDCPDGSDEPADICGKYHCSHHGMFQCSNATSSLDCLLPTQICDGKPQCADKSDEAICSTYSCLEHFVKCKKDNKCIPKSFVCDGEPHCSDSEDEKNCTVQKCTKAQFQCDNGKCVPYVWKCDNDDDCGDGSDEPLDCKNTTCKSDHFKCNTTGRCIPEAWKCDGEMDCGTLDMSDEDGDECHEKTCAPNHFLCTNGFCVPKKWRCDHIDDCKDGTDELHCSPRNCTATEFQCNNKKCIPESHHCNGIFDCLDRSDENCTATCDPETEFKCLKYPACISKKWRCDGDSDCSDGTDEWNCRRNCSEHEFKCQNDLCISSQFVCDGEDDCKDNSDEDRQMCADKPCPPGRFRCKSHKCIWTNKVCDLSKDCEDGEDEDAEMCSIVDKCKAPNFLCESRTQCLHSNQVCNGQKDCVDGSDELSDFCQYLKMNKTQFCSVNNGGCEHDCKETKFGPLCSCKKYYKLNLDGLTCSYVDPCLELDSCSQICESLNEGTMIGKAKCSCMSGYTYLKRDNRCAASGPPAEILLPVPGNTLKNIQLKTLNDYNYDQDTDKKFGVDHILSMDVDAKANSAFIVNRTGTDYFLLRHSPFREEENNKRTRREASANEVETLHFKDTSLFSISSLVVDWVSQHLYLIDATNQAIHVYNYDARRGKVVAKGNMGQPHSLAIDPIAGRIFWTDSGAKPKIESANLDGSERYILASVEMAMPTGIVADIGKGWIYWADTKKHTVEAARYDGTGRKTIYHSVFSKDAPYALELFEDHLYVLTHTSNALWKLDKFGNSKTPSQILATLPNTRDITIVQISKQVQVASNCTATTCHETQVCFNRPHGPQGYSCLCPDGATFRDNKCDFEKPPSCDSLYCLNGGTCEEWMNGRKIKCTCPPTHKGVKCEKSVCDDFCFNEAKCLPPIDGEKQPSCSCKNGYHGVRCELAPCQGLCLNGGVCQLDTHLNHHCICPIDYKGERCEVPVPVTEWCPKQCHNNGTCQKETSGYIACKCPPGFYGAHCEHCWDLTCYSRGVCVKDQRGRSVCQCAEGLDPLTKCLKKLSCEALCQASNAVVPGYCDCKCKPFFWTSDCSSCESYCKQGTCSLDNGRAQCQCDEVHEGDRCEVCKCGDAGKCAKDDKGKGICQCSLETFGRVCELNCFGSCGGTGGLCHQCFLNQTTHLGQCVQGHCVCSPGNTGQFCESALATTEDQGDSSGINPIMAVCIAVALVVIIVIIVVIIYFKKRTGRSQYVHKRMNASGENLNVSNPVFMKRVGDEEDDEDEEDEYQPLEGGRPIFTGDAGDDSTNFANPMYDAYSNNVDIQQKLISDSIRMEENHNYADPMSVQYLGSDELSVNVGSNNTTTTSLA